MERTLISIRDVAQAIDHSLLRPELTIADLREGCAVGRKYDVVSMCVRPSDLPIVVEELAGTRIRPTTVIGFPHGAATTESKLAEALDAIAKGAVEIDMVINIGRLRSDDLGYVENELRAMVGAAHGRSALIKVIFENYYLTDEQKVTACRLAEAAGADFVKTSTGYADGGATIPDLLLMRRTCSPHVRVKAAGGIRTLDEALAAITAGADRIGTRSTATILDEARKRADRDGNLPFSPAGTLSSRGY